MTDPEAIYEALREEISTVLIGKESLIEGLTIALLMRGHILIEGVPGVAKTTAANLFATASGLEYSRIQMTPDILPADITGTHVYREAVGEFELQKGPVFANLVVADEINRATPKSQSALLEAMQERTVTLEGETLRLPDPFMVIATQNPIELEGTYPLPEAQQDRFMFKLVVGHPRRDEEAALLDRFDESPDLSPDSIERVVTPEELLEARESARSVFVADSVKEYALDIVEKTRSNPDIEYGASPRASLAFLNAGKARAALHGRQYVIPDDINELAEPILAHRIVLSTEADLGDLNPRAIVSSVVESIEPPSGEVELPDQSGQ